MFFARYPRARGAPAMGRGTGYRTPGTPSNRRIHWLDARIHTPEMVGMMAAIRRFLARYRTVTVG
jgi:hypothetical protein